MKSIFRMRSLCLSVLMLVQSAILFFIQTPAFGQTILDAWDTVKPPSPPEVKAVIADPKTTALLLLDFNKQTCNPERRPRCIATVPNVKRLLDGARAKGITVVYSLSAGAVTSDIAKELAPEKGEPAVTSGPDKFLGTELEKILKEKNIQTVIVAGTAAHGAVLYTASGAALRGMQVIVPADGLSAETLYPEQYTLWHLTNAPRVSGRVTITRTDLITY